MAEKWLTPGDVADELGVDRMTVYRMLEAGTIRGYRFGRLYRVRPEDLEAYIRASRLPGDAGRLPARLRCNLHPQCAGHLAPQHVTVSNILIPSGHRPTLVLSAPPP